MQISCSPQVLRRACSESRFAAACVLLCLYTISLCAQENTTAQKDSVISLDLTSTTFPLNADGYWEEAYNANEKVLSFNDGMFNFSHLLGMDASVGATESNYWDGFCYSTNGDITNYGGSSSSVWIDHQWGCMAGGGLVNDSTTKKGAPYLAAYWGYYYETEYIHTCQIEFDGQAHRIKGIWLCPHPWPYYGCLYGDGFAHAFDTDGQNYTVIIHGLKDGIDTGSKVTVTMAEYMDGDLCQPTAWRYVNLESLGLVDAVYFTMTSTDSDANLGMNTACYFCVGGMDIYPYIPTLAPERPSAIEVTDIAENTITVKWPHVDGTTIYTLFVDGEEAGTATDTTFCFTALKPYTSYLLGVRADNNYGMSDITSITAQTVDLTAPTAPENVIATDIATDGMKLSWDVSTDNVAVYRYEVYANGELMARPKKNTYTMTGLEPNTLYTIEVDAQDASKNTSEKTVISVRTNVVTSVSNVAPDVDYNNNHNVYDLCGKQVDSSTKGIVIVNGKKILR